MLKIRVEAGPHKRTNTPLVARLRGDLPSSGFFVLVDEKGRKIPVQVSKNGGEVELCWIMDSLESFETRTLSLIRERTPLEFSIPPLEIIEEEDKISLFSDSQMIMSFIYSNEFSKPFIYPLNGPKGALLTCNGPSDYVYHRSLWTAHGMVNGKNLWLEGPNCGKISVVNISKFSGRVFSEINLKLVWKDSSNKKLVDENRVIRLWNIPDKQWLIDYSVTFIANHGNVLFGDTEDAGIISVRVRESMEVENGGKIENSWGGINEAEAWGKKANWCDYSGPVDGLWQGIAIFDSPSNPRHPSYWQVCDYGLMTANIFGVTDFQGREDEKGGLLVKSGNNLRFCYRVYVHEGDAKRGKVSEKYLDYVVPPKVSIVIE